MPDLMDSAQELECLQREQALSKIKPVKGISLVYCVDCEDVIPQNRRIAVPGCTRCLSCAEDFEHRIKR
jgi:phage/conjugal plasmid C-4 type zinc finger TraR family protein